MCWLGANRYIPNSTVGSLELAQHKLPLLRVASVCGYTREAILFAANGALLTFSPEGALQAPQLRLKRPPWPTDSESWACRQRARFVGRWLATAGDNATIFAIWGVRP